MLTLEDLTALIVVLMGLALFGDILLGPPLPPRRGKGG